MVVSDGGLKQTGNPAEFLHGACAHVLCVARCLVLAPSASQFIRSNALAKAAARRGAGRYRQRLH
ncbi:MAG: hypothetical protein ABIQ70_14165 [Dokdonella sp.]